MSEEKIKCRGCRRELRPNSNGEPAVLKANGSYSHSAKWNYFGGWVCSRICDYRSCLELEGSMPGHGGQRELSRGSESLKSVNAHWPQD